MSSRRAIRSLLVLLLGSSAMVALAAQGFTIFGVVNLPGGGRAPRVRVRIEGLNGLQREMITDDQGNYQFVGVPGGRYRLTVTNPEDDKQFTDPTEADTSRSFANRVQVHLYLRHRVAPAKSEEKPKAGVVNVAEAGQNIPKNARKAFEDGMKAKREGKLDRARDRFDQAVSHYPSYFQALSERGELRMQTRDMDGAIADFEQALKINADYAPALRGAALCLLEQRKLAEAAERFTQAVTIEPDHAATHLMLGYVYLLLDEREPARQALEGALRIDEKGAARARVYLADLYAREGRFKEAADSLWAYLEANPAAPDAQRLRSQEIQLRARAVK